MKQGSIDMRNYILPEEWKPSDKKAVYVGPCHPSEFDYSVKIALPNEAVEETESNRPAIFWEAPRKVRNREYKFSIIPSDNKKYNRTLRILTEETAMHAVERIKREYERLKSRRP